MNCPTENDLHAYLRGEINDDRRDEIEDHVEGCAFCSRRLSELGDADSALNQRQGLAGVLVIEGLDPQIAGQLDADGYSLIKKLGSGGVGTVFRARERAADRDVAIKVLNADRLNSNKARSGFAQEINTLANIHRDGIVPVFKAGVLPNGQRYVAMRFFSGGSLREVIEENSHGMDPKRAARLVKTIAEAMHHVHNPSSGGAIVHLDLKPENILLDDDGNPHVADFGLAAAVRELHVNDGGVGLTLPYASPEQVRAFQRRKNGGIDGRSDIWSLGVILYELLTATRPFNGITSEDLAESIERGHRTAEAQLSTKRIASRLTKIIDKCLNTDPAERFQSARELADAISHFLQIDEANYDIPELWALQEKHRDEFVGRSDVLQSLENWLDQAIDDRYLLLLGPRGQGKSALLAEFAYQQGARRDADAGACLYHSIKVCRDSRRLLQFLLWQAQELVDKPLHGSSYSHDVSELRNCLVTALEIVRDKFGRATVIVDGLDELETIAKDIEILPHSLPEGVRCILSCRPNIPLVRHLRNWLKIDDANTINLPPISEPDFGKYVEKSLEPTLVSRLKALQRIDFQTLFDHTGGNALVIWHNIRRIRTACEKAIRLDEELPSFDTDILARTDAEVFAEIYNEVAEKTVGAKRSQTESGRDKAKILQLLSVAREGLALDQIRGLLRAGNRSLSREETQDLVHSMSEYLVGDKRYSPFLTGLGDYVRNHVLAPDEVANLHAQFCKFLRESSQAESVYRLRYQPSHLLSFALGCDSKNQSDAPFSELAVLLKDLKFLEAKIAARLVFDLVKDCRQTAMHLPADIMDGRVYSDIAGCLASAAIYLTQHPHCVFQCLWNYCTSSTLPLFPAILKHWRSDWEARNPGLPWVRLLRQYPGNDPHLLHRLVEPRAPVLRLVGVDGATAAFSANGRLYVWDECGRLQFEMQAEEEEFFVPLAFDSRGSHLLVATGREFRVLHLGTGSESSWIDKTPRKATPLSAVESTNGAQVLLSNGTLVEWSKLTGFTSSTIVEDVVLEAGAVSRSGCWMAVTDTERLIGRINATPVDVSLPYEISEAIRHGRNNGFFGQTHLHLFCDKLATQLLEQMRAIWQPYVALHAETGWIAVLNEMETEFPEADEFELFTKNGVTLWHPDRSASLITKHWSGESCERLSFADEAQLLAIGMTDGRIRVVAIHDDSVNWTRKSHDDRVTAMCWTRSCALVSSGSSGTVPEGRGDDNQVIVQHFRPMEEQYPEIHVDRVTSICCSPDGNTFGSGDKAGRVALWNASDGSLRHLQVPKRTLLDNESKETDNWERRVFEAWTGHQTSVSHMTFTPDSRLLVTASDDATIWLWKTDAGTAFNNLWVENDVQMSPAQCWMSVSANGRVVAAMDASGAVGAWDIVNECQELLRVGENDSDGAQVTLSHDGRLLVTTHRIRPKMNYNAPIEQQLIRNYEYHIVVRDLERNETIRQWTTSLPAAQLDLRMTLLETKATVPLLVIGAGDWLGRIWHVQIWGFTANEPIFEKVLPGSVEGFEFIVKTLKDSMGVSSPPSAVASTLRARPWKGRGETAFTYAGKDEAIAWYRVAFDGIVGSPCGRLFCGHSGRELHFLRIECASICDDEIAK